jgi:hypothetical protein
LWSFEQFSATPRAENQMSPFRDALEVYGLVDLGFSGIPYTYNNKCLGGSNVKVCLDKALASNSWRNMYPYCSVQHIVTPCLDHVALLVKGEVEEHQTTKKGCKQFEIMWERDHGLPEVIKNAWSLLGDVYALLFL